MNYIARRGFLLPLLANRRRNLRTLDDTEYRMTKLPHAIPYQGSKRSLAQLIGRYIPSDLETFYEPFAGSAAMSIYAAHHRRAKRFIIADSLEPIVELHRLIVEKPKQVAQQYRSIWERQIQTNDMGYFNEVRERYNNHGDPVDLLYLTCRCVKNAVRFNSRGRFTQSVDKRRLGMRPARMEEAVDGVSFLLKGKVEFRKGDWLETTSDAGAGDFIYMDPPYLGTSIGRDKRYHRQMTQETLIAGLQSLCRRDVRIALSYDGMTGEKEYGPPLPDELGLTRLLLHGGRSSQATLAGRSDETIESLYISPSLGSASEQVIRKPRAKQDSCDFLGD